MATIETDTVFLETSPQLSLGLELNYTKTLDQFYAGPNDEAVSFIKELLNGEAENFVYIFGSERVGKTHLLQAACNEAQRQHLSAMYVSLAGVKHCPEAILENLECLSLVCLDDIDAICGDELWEEKLFHLFNAIRARGSNLLIAATKPARELNFNLADLKSRLSWGLTFKIRALTDKELAQAFCTQAKLHGLNVGDDVIEFLMNRLPRSVEEVMNVFDLLNKASMVAQRKITVPFVKQVLAL